MKIQKTLYPDEFRVKCFLNRIPILYLILRILSITNNIINRGNAVNIIGCN